MGSGEWAAENGQRRMVGGGLWGFFSCNEVAYWLQEWSIFYCDVAIVRESSAGYSRLQKPFENKNANPGKTLLTNAHVMDPESGLEIATDGEVLIHEGKIAEVGQGILAAHSADSFDEVIDCKGMLVAPGLVDIQVHFRDPGQTHKEDITSGSISAVAGGVTSVVCQPNTSPTLDCKYTLDYLWYKARSEAYCNVFAYASLTKELGGVELTDMEALAEHPAVCGFTDDGLPLASSNLMRKAFEVSSVTGKVVAQHAEDKGLSGAGCVNEGLASASLAVRGIPNVSESIVVERDLALLRAFGGHYHVLHVSTSEAMKAIIKGKEDGLNVTCEVSPHHISLDESAVLGYNTNAKMNPPLRSIKDVDFLRNAVRSGYVDAIATDHAPHDEESKERTIEEAPFGIVGLETLLPISLEFYHDKSLSLMKLLAILTYKPADIVRLKQKGRLQVGCDADVCVIDLGREWIIDPSKLLSKSHNTPFGGRRVLGMNIMTFVSGVKVFDTTG